MKTTTMFALGLALLCTSTTAFAKTKSATSSTPTHHCKLHGAEVPKSKSACLKAGGTWEKGAPGAKAPTGTTTEPAK
jgi:hypothetical protein